MENAYFFEGGFVSKFCLIMVNSEAASRFLEESGGLKLTEYQEGFSAYQKYEYGPASCCVGYLAHKTENYPEKAAKCYREQVQKEIFDWYMGALNESRVRNPGVDQEYEKELEKEW